MKKNYIYENKIIFIFDMKQYLNDTQSPDINKT
jgi:hypothetical protein